MTEYSKPGQLINDLLEQRGWSQRTLALVIEKSESTINKIISGKSTVTSETALALEDVFGVTAERFLDLQKKYDLAIARISIRPEKSRETRAALFGDLPIKAMIDRGWISAKSPQDLKEVEAGLVAFFGVSTANEIEILPHAAKKTAVNIEATPAQMAWLYRVKSIAEEMLVGRFSQNALDKALIRLHSLTLAPEEARKVPRILAECGIRFVIVEALPSTKIDGVCYWLDNASPVVGLSMRHDRIDNFWFVLRHELEHVRLGHGKSEWIIDTNLDGSEDADSVTKEERLANAAAQEFCVPRDQMQSYVDRKSPYFSERDMIGFSKMLRVHPGIVAGQLQRETGRFDRFRQHLVEIRKHVRAGAAVDGWGDIYPIGD